MAIKDGYLKMLYGVLKTINENLKEIECKIDNKILKPFSNPGFQKGSFNQKVLT